MIKFTQLYFYKKTNGKRDYWKAVSPTDNTDFMSDFIMVVKKSDLFSSLPGKLAFCLVSRCSVEVPGFVSAHTRFAVLSHSYQCIILM